MRAVLILLALLALSAPHALARPRPGNMTVYAAASLRDALEEVNAAYARRGAGRITASYAASSVIARQIEQGAPADVIISADSDWMDYLDRRGLIRRDSRRPLLTNRLALIAPAASPVRLKVTRGMPLGQALGRGRLALAGPDVPAGRYARAALSALGIWESVASRVVRGENVRSTQNFVALGEAPLGVVYDTDALVDPRVKIVGLFPEDSHPPIIYPTAAVARSRNPSSTEYIRFLESSEASAIFRKYGFETLPH